MTALTEYAPAKVNLSLHVGAVKLNGRHDLISLVTFSDQTVCDLLSAEPATGFSLAVDGPFAQAAGPARDNLVLQAARAMNEILDGNAPPLAFRLTKRLPCAAGIGGGSSDAAAALRLIARAHGGDRVRDLTKQVAPELGGDVLACLTAFPGMMTGEGDTYQAMLGIPPLPAILVNPGTVCLTGPVFAAYDETPLTEELDHPLPPAGRARETDFVSWLKANTTNSLQEPSLRLHPELGAVALALTELPGVRLTRMTGSGATFFALFDTLEAAERAAGSLMVLHPDWWVRATLLGGG